jgi:hypothetical protein
MSLSTERGGAGGATTTVASSSSLAIMDTNSTASAAAAAIRNSVIAPADSVPNLAQPVVATASTSNGTFAAPDASNAPVPNDSHDPADLLDKSVYLSRLQAILLSLIFLVGMILVGIFGVCGTNGCSLSSSSAAREGQVVAFINEITTTNRTLVVNRSVPYWYFDDDELEDWALLWLVQNDTLRLRPDTPVNRFRLGQRYAMVTLSVQLLVDDTDSAAGADECDWFYVTCQPIHLGSELGIQMP